MSNKLIPNDNLRYIRLLEEHTELKKEFEDIKIELEKLKKEYEENTIINSMNDMKKSYEIQEKKIDKLKIYINEISNYTKTVITMSEVISKNISDYSNMRTYRYELRTRLEFMVEILESSLKRKNELLYLQ